MRHLLIIFIAVCLVACLFYFRIRPNAKKTWILGLFLSAIAALIAPNVLQWTGSAMTTLVIYAGLGLAILGVTAAASLRRPKARQEAPVMIRYHFREAPQMRMVAAMDAGMVALEDTGRLPVLAAETALPQPEGIPLEESGKRFRKAHPARDERPVRDGEDFRPMSHSLMRQRWGVISGGKLRVANIPEMGWDHRPMAIAPADVRDVEEPLKEWPVVDIVEEMETAEPLVAEPPLEKAASSRRYATMRRVSHPRRLHGQYPWPEERPHPSFAEPLREEEGKKTGQPDVPVRRVLPRSHPRLRRIAALPGEPRRPDVADMPAEAPAPRLGDEGLLDRAFDLKGSGQWMAAAEAFRGYALTAAAPWVRKQADVERLSCLINGGDRRAAADLVFEILEGDYSLSPSERDQIIESLRKLQYQEAT